MAVTARGLAKAAEILAGQFTLVATNVPYLGRRKQDDVLKDYCERVHPDGKTELATCFIERSLAFCASGGSAALLVPQNWLFLGTFEALRKKLLNSATWDFVCRMGSKAFQTPMYDFGVVMHSFTKHEPNNASCLSGLDIGTALSPELKSEALPNSPVSVVNQLGQLKNPDIAIVFEDASTIPLLLNYAASLQGCGLADIVIFRKLFWEIERLANGWVAHQSSPDGVGIYTGLHFAVKWDEGKGALANSPEARIQGRQAWGKNGIACAWLGRLPAGLYLGTLFDNSVAAIVPKDPTHLGAIWCFTSSPEFVREVRKINQKAQVANATLVKVPFDLVHWQKVAAEKYLHGLPKPFSSDPTQWLFNGHPAGADQPLHVAVARLLGYQWPRQTGSSFPDCPALDPDGLEAFADADGIVPISPTKGEAAAAEQLRDLLARAYGLEWSASRQQELLAQVDSAGASLEDWLRNAFFEQHCKLFQNRPFIWHIWDGHKSGFSALVNCHKLTHANLEKLTYAYLGDWIRRQQAAVDAGESGSDARLQAAKNLQATLKLILEGEPPFDLFVRWKALSLQAIGWHPDLNDGVRMNIRPFMARDIPGGKKGAGVLRAKPNIKWDKDRGKEPTHPKAEYPWFWGWDEKTPDFAGVSKESDGNRWNNCHYSNEFKRKARGA
jgi:hypothetical protein